MARIFSAQVVVTTANGSSDAYTVTAAARTPGVLSPPSFKVNGKQYVAGILNDGFFTGPSNLIPGVAFRPVKIGETFVLYGVGFGATVPPQPTGTIFQGSRVLPNVSVQIGTATAATSFAGMTSIGLYQFNIIVPPGATGDLSLKIQVDGVDLGQVLTVTVGP